MTDPYPDLPPPEQREPGDPAPKSDPALERKPDYQPLIYSLLTDLKNIYGRLDERTQALKNETGDLKSDLREIRTDIKSDLREIRTGQKDLVTDKFAWRMVKVFLAFGAIIVTLITGIMYYAATHHSHQVPIPPVIQSPTKADPGTASP